MNIYIYIYLLYSYIHIHRYIISIPIAPWIAPCKV